MSTLLLVLLVTRPYVGPIAVEPAPEPDGASPIAAATVTTVPATTPSPATTPPASARPPTDERTPEPRTRWRVAVLLGTRGVIAFGDEGDVGAALDGFIGAGIPARRREGRRARHAFGYTGEVSFGFYEGIIHRHRVTATGLWGPSKSEGGRRVALYYFAALGTRVRDVWAGASLGARIGLAVSRRVDYVLALGGDLDVTPFRGRAGIEGGPRRDFVFVTPSINVSLLTFGSL